MVSLTYGSCREGAKMREAGKLLERSCKQGLCVNKCDGTVKEKV